MKEVLVLLIDVGPSMHDVIPEVEMVCSLLVQKKLIFGKSDEVGVVLFGTEDTNNDLEKEVGGYEHVVVSRNISVVDGGATTAVQNLPRGTYHGDFLDAIVVGLDMLLKRIEASDKGKKRICLITDAKHPTKEPYDGTKEEQVDTIAEQMKAKGIRLDCLVMRGDLLDHQSTMEENDKLLHRISSKTIAKVVQVDCSTSLLGALKTRNISPATIFRGDMEISSKMRIKVWVYKKTSEEKFPTLKKYSDKAPPTDKYATHEIKMVYEYKSVEDPDKVVPPEQRIKGYRYGPQVVPISSAEWEAVKFKPEKGVQLLGFTDNWNIFRHYYMKDVYTFIPEPGNRKAALAVSALARAMKELDKSAILRCVWRQGQGNVVIGVLRPNISSLDTVPDSFYLNLLPFAEDIRDFQFPSLSSFPSIWQPDEKQQAATDDFVRLLNLAPPGREVLPPDYTPNPVLQRFYSFLDLRGKQPESDIPQLERSLKCIAEPDPDTLADHDSTISNFQKQFELKENTMKKKTSGRALRDIPSALDRDEVGICGEVSELQSLNSKLKLLVDEDKKGGIKTREVVNAHQIKGLPSVKVEKIGDLNPVKDFEAMMSRRDSSNWAEKAIEQMEHYITILLENSYNGDSFPLAIECMAALRRGCIIEQEPNKFNKYLQDIYRKWHDSDLAGFFNLLSQKNIRLIGQNEASSSDLTEEEAIHFTKKS